MAVTRATPPCLTLRCSPNTMAPFTLLLVTCALAATFTASHGCYMITTPRQWTAGEELQLCVMVYDTNAPQGSIQVMASELKPKHRYSGEMALRVIPKLDFPVPAGKTELCKVMHIPGEVEGSVLFHVSGQLCGEAIYRHMKVDIVSRESKTFIQTDKFHYRPGQMVQFRVLTIDGPTLEVSNTTYPEIWITTPTNTRIAQWRNVVNIAGLIHLSFTLVDEPEMGRYTIHVKMPNNVTQHQHLEVKDYVLPRFEVTITTPPILLKINPSFTLTVCAKYTFGQPVKGTVALRIYSSSKCNTFNTAQISGCRDIVVSTKDLFKGECYVHTLTINATVEEEGTGVRINSEVKTEVDDRLFTFKILSRDNYMKPNLPFTFKARAERPDGSGAVGEPVEVCCGKLCYNRTVTHDGTFTASLPHCDQASIALKGLTCWTNMNAPRDDIHFRRYFSPTNSSLTIRAHDGKLMCSPEAIQEHVLYVAYSRVNTTISDITIQVVSRGKIQYFKSQQVANERPLTDPHLLAPLPPLPPHYQRGEFKLSIFLPPTASPIVKVLVWCIREDGEVVSDTRELEVEKCLVNRVNLTLTADVARPGAVAMVDLVSPPYSLCSLGVVDRSVELLAPQRNTLTVDKVFEVVRPYTITDTLNHEELDNLYCKIKLDDGEAKALDYQTKDVDALRMFDDTGVYVLSDITLETRPCEEKPPTYRPLYNKWRGGPQQTVQFAKAPPPPPTSSLHRQESQFIKVGVPDEVEEETPTDAPRTEFPETWLWDLLPVPASGFLRQKVTLPDTITQWVGKAVCVHPKKGVGLSQRASITTFIPFFIDLTLPPSVKRGEVLHVKVSVFNYVNHSLPVTVILQKSKQLEVIKTQEQLPPGQHRSCVAAQEKVAHTVEVKPLAIGDVNISVLAYVDNTIKTVDCDVGESFRDYLIKSINVEAEGFPREDTWTTYVCPQEDKALGTKPDLWEVTVPEGVVKGSARGWVTVVGDLLSLTLENLGSLIRLPTGGGEQNMINFAPNIYIQQYLTATKQTTPQTTKNLITYMERGYQRELQYRHPDGSFSAFGKTDRTGSTWLTAFVVKSFAQAQPFILIDKDDLAKSTSWLLSKQGKDGCFISTGKVLHKGMKGGVDGRESPVPLTAYVMVALLEAGEDLTSVGVKEAIRCITSHQVYDPYVMSLKAYALALANMPEAEAVIQDVVTMVNEHKIPDKFFINGKGTALAVEGSGYLMLAIMAHDPRKFHTQAMNLAKWITKHRNGQGGFISTQDTVVALQALARFSAYTYRESMDLTVILKANGLHHKFVVNNNNKLLQQLVMLPNIPTFVNHTVTGEGCAVVQAVLRYNNIKPDPSDAFSVHVITHTPSDKNCITKHIRVCASYLLSDGTSNLAIIEVNIVTGYLPMKDDLQQVIHENPNVIMRADVDGSKVLFYVKEFASSKEVCVEFRVVREVNVELVKPGTVLVYDYYQPGFHISKTYTLPPATDCVYYSTQRG